MPFQAPVDLRHLVAPEDGRRSSWGKRKPMWLIDRFIKSVEADGRTDIVDRLVPGPGFPPKVTVSSRCARFRTDVRVQVIGEEAIPTGAARAW